MTTHEDTPLDLDAFDQLIADQLLSGQFRGKLRALLALARGQRDEITRLDAGWSEANGSKLEADLLIASLRDEIAELEKDKVRLNKAWMSATQQALENGGAANAFERDLAEAREVLQEVHKDHEEFSESESFNALQDSTLARLAALLPRGDSGGFTGVHDISPEGIAQSRKDVEEGKVATLDEFRASALAAPRGDAKCSEGDLRDMAKKNREAFLAKGDPGFAKCMCRDWARNPASFVNNPDSHNEMCPHYAAPRGEGEPTMETRTIDIVFVFDDAAPPLGPRFVEVESPPGVGIAFGEWVTRPDGYQALRFDCTFRAPVVADSEQGGATVDCNPIKRSERDWDEDFGHENGDYCLKCITCKEQFRGHKRRTSCRTCQQGGE